MAAPIGNKFWELRSKHGRDRLFATPELLWEAATEYFDWVLENPLMQIDYKGKDADRVEIPHVKPFTIHGLCLYLDCNVKFFNDFENAIRDREDQLSKDFSTILTRIRETIYNQKFDGAACGFYNSSIIARDLGLQETVNSNVVSKNEITVMDEETKKAVEDMRKKFEEE